jgi:hypothetical protein
VAQAAFHVKRGRLIRRQAPPATRIRADRIGLRRVRARQAFDASAQRGHFVELGAQIRDERVRPLALAAHEAVVGRERVANASCRVVRCTSPTSPSVGFLAEAHVSVWWANF